MTKEEFFISAVDKLSPQATHIISALNITVDNIGNFSFADLKNVRGAGCRAAMEIVNLKCELGGLFPFDCVWADEYMHIDSSSTCKYIKDDLSAGNNIDNITQEYNEYIEKRSPFLDKVLIETYKKIYQKCTFAQCEIIHKYFPHFVDVLSKKVSSIEINARTKGRREWIFETLSLFQSSYLTEVRFYFNMSNDELEWQAFFEDKNYLNQDDRDFIKQFKSRESHFPCFYIIYKRLTYNELLEYYAIYSSYIGLLKEAKTPLELCQEYHVNGRRFWDIIFVAIEMLSATLRALPYNEDYMKIYPFLNNDFLTIENTNFQELSSKEHLSFDFSAFCHLCFILSSNFLPISFYMNDAGVLVLHDIKQHKQRIYTTAYQQRLHVSYYTILHNLQKDVNKTNKIQYKIADYCQQVVAKSDCSLDLIPQITCFVEHLVKNVLHYQVVDGVIVRQPNDNDIKQVLYDCLKESDTPLSLIELFDAYRKKVPDSKYQTPKQIKSAIVHSDKIVVIGGKSLYTLAERENPQTYKGSLYDAIEEALKNFDTPQKRDELIAAALQLRPDSSAKSMRAIIASMLRANRLKLFNEELIGLPRVKYGKSFEISQYETRKTFEEQLENLRTFVTENSRFPFTGGGTLEERSLAVWYNRMHQNNALTTEQMVALYNFQQEIIAANIPQTADQFTFRKNCTTYKASVMRTGNLVRITQDERLYEWFRRSCSKYASLKDVRKVYFDELISFLAAFGYEINLM